MAHNESANTNRTKQENALSPSLKRRYTWVRQLGQGGQGVVHLVTDRYMGNRLVVMKTLRPQAEETWKVAFRHEFEALAGLKHPRLSEVYDFGTTKEGRVFFTRDFVAGDDLRTATANINLCRVVALFVEICRALKPLHSHGLVHGDLKPGNIICSQDGLARLIDFSFVRASNDDAQHHGTVPFMAPEVIEGRKADARADLYSLGCTLFDIVAGSPPFEGSVSDVVKGHLGLYRPELSAKRIDTAGNESVFFGLASIAKRLLSCDPNERYPNIYEVEAALTAICPECVPPDPLPVSPVVSEFIGRDIERNRIKEAVSTRLCSSDLSPLVMVTGEFGTGRGAMLKSVKWWAELEEMAVLEMRGNGNLLRPIADIVEQAVGYLEGIDAHAKGKQLLSVLAEPPGRGAHMDGLTKAVAELLVQIAQKQRLILLVEGVDQIPQESLNVLRGLIASVTREDPLTVLCSSEKSFPWQARLGAGVGIEMPMLNEAQITPLVECFLGSSDTAVTKRILRHTGGNPLFVTTLLADLAASPEGAPRLESLGAPQQLEQYWRDRFEEISNIGQGVLTAAAVLDRPAETEELAELLEIETTHLESVLPSLALNGWLRRLGAGWHIASEPLGQEILTTQNPDIVTQLHRHAMDMETDETRQLFHAAKCGETIRLRERALTIALSLKRMGALQAARELLNVTLDALSTDPLVDSIRLELGQVCLSQGDLDSAKSHLLPLTGANDMDLRRKALVNLGKLNRITRDFKAAQSYLDLALEIEAGAVETAKTLFERANVQFKKGELEGCNATCEEALTGLSKGHRVRADLLGLQAKTAVREGRHEDALLLAKEAESDAHLAGDMRSMALAIDILAWTNHLAGNLTQAVEENERAAALYRDIGDLPSLIRSHMILGALKILLNDWAEALKYYEKAVRLVRSATDPVLRLDVQNNFGFSLTMMGSFERAHLVLTNAAQTAAEQGHEEQQLFSLFHLATLAAAKGEFDIAFKRYVEAKTRFDKLDRPAIVCEIELEMAGYLMWRNEGDDLATARALITTAADRERDEEGRYFEESLSLQQGTLDLLSGRMERGIAQLDELCDNPNAPLDYVWQAHFAAARGYLAGETAFMARQRLRKAEEILDRLSNGLSPEQRLAFWQDVRRQEIRNLLSEITSSGQFTSSQLLVEAEGQLDAEAQALYRVLELNKYLLSEHDLDHLLDLILTSAIELTGAERGLVLLPPEGQERGILEVRATTDQQTAVPELHDSFSRSIAESVFLDGEPVVTIDAMRDNRFNEFLSIHELKLKSVACMPVSNRGRSLGVLYLENRLRRGRFDGKDLRVLAAFADQVAIAISSARLVSEARLRTKELETAREALQEAYDQKISDLTIRDHDLKLARDRLKRMQRQLEGEGEYHGVFGHSQKMQAVFSLIERVKDLNVPVVFIGESGTGKDLLARLLHEQSNRKESAFVVAGCGSVPESLVESMLFGHEKGAFSGADASRDGLLQTANGGTLYFDELGDMSPRMQVDLLRVLQEKSFTPLGSPRTIQTNVRIIASSRTPLEKLVANGTLRQDLLYRLQVVTIEIPPLRERRDDILPLSRRILDREAERFAQQRRKLSKKAASALINHPWPGNVRELEQVLRRTLAVGEGTDEIEQDELFGNDTAPAPIPGYTPGSDSEDHARIVAALEQVKWNRTKAAELLGIPRRTFYRKLDKMGLIKKRG